MNSSSFKFTLRTFTMSALAMVMLYGCGAKDEEILSQEGSSSERGTGSQEVDQFKDQNVFCYEGENACPSSVAKVVSLKSGSVQQCTGFLVSNNLMVTAASCLPNHGKSELEGSRCDNLYVIFPQTKNFPKLRIGCERILKVSQTDKNLDPALWGHNVALIQLAGSTNREALTYSYSGLAENKKVEVWKVSTEHLANKDSFLKRYECNLIYKNYSNPIADHPMYPHQTIGNCLYKDRESGIYREEKTLFPGFMGGPVVVNNRVAGVISVPSISKEEFDNLKNQGKIHERSEQKPLMFASNITCTENVLISASHPNCNITATEEDLRIKRQELLTQNTQAGVERAREIVKDLTKLDNTPKLQWMPNFSAMKNQKIEVKHIPVCLSKPEKWLKDQKGFHVFILGFKKKGTMEVVIPGFEIRVKLNENLVPYADYINIEAKKYKLDVEPKNIDKKKYSSVRVYGAQFDGSDIDDTYDGDNKINVCP
jgi:hypothetical protein